jgi:hypothetical protein
MLTPTDALALVAGFLAVLLIAAALWRALAGPDPDLAAPDGWDPEPWHLEPLYRTQRPARPVGRVPWQGRGR